MKQKDFCNSLNLGHLPTEYGQVLLALYQLLKLKKQYVVADASGEPEKILEVKQNGICNFVKIPCQLKIKLFESWQHFKGDYCFPIGCVESVRILYVYVATAQDLTPEVLHYLNLREDLLDHCIKELQEMATQLKNS